MKNVMKLFAREQTKSDSKDKKEAEDSERREKNLEEAKKITIENDSSLPEPKTVRSTLFSLVSILSNSSLCVLYCLKTHLKK
uniref:Asparagine--tRNA ligase N-terminal domain-containing protein n=1 Tax=Hucho hucho TaxID=62062 RepID=A0A4W5K1C8_9TELE